MQINFGLIIFALVFGGAGFAVFNKHLKAKRLNTEEAVAEVVAYHTEISHGSKGRRSTSYYPVVRYQVNGEWFENRTDTGRGSKPFNLGDQIKIMYNPENPASFHIYGDNSSFIFGGIFMAIGVFLLYMGLTGK